MKSKNRTIRRITVDNQVYGWHVSSPEDDYGAVQLRVWEDKILILDFWLRPEHQPITPKFVAEQIGYWLKPVEFVRTAGEAVCGVCGKFHREHPMGGPFMCEDNFEPSRQWLHRLCDGNLVKL